MDIRSRRFLVYGVFISLALHLSAGSLIRITPVPEPVESSLPFVMETAQPRPMPTPPPTPKPTPPRAPPPKPARTQPTLPPQIRIITPHVTPRSSGPTLDHTAPITRGDRIDGTRLAGNGTSDTASPAPAITAAATTPAPTPTPAACAHPFVPPATIDAATVDTTQLAAQNGITVIVDVVVSLDRESHVTSVSIRTSPSPILNQAALEAARASRFRTEVRDCIPVAAEYLFAVEFSGQ
jgi:outer membrane biosynthesis protein TonB